MGKPLTGAQEGVRMTSRGAGSGAPRLGQGPWELSQVRGQVEPCVLTLPGLGGAEPPRRVTPSGVSKKEPRRTAALRAGWG